MAEPPRVILDDRLLIEELLVGLPSRSSVTLHTTTLWYYRACRAAVAGAGGHLSAPFAQLGSAHQDQAILSLLELSANITLPNPRETVPVMARLALRHPRLNLLNLEAAAAAQVLTATVWLSSQGAVGVLPAVLNEVGIVWRTIAIL